MPRTHDSSRDPALFRQHQQPYIASLYWLQLISQLQVQNPHDMCCCSWTRVLLYQAAHSVRCLTITTISNPQRCIQVSPFLPSLLLLCLQLPAVTTHSLTTSSLQQASISTLTLTSPVAAAAVLTVASCYGPLADNKVPSASTPSKMPAPARKMLQMDGWGGQTVGLWGPYYVGHAFW